MQQRKLLSLFGLKWNPFTQDVPAEALLASPRIENFRRRLEAMIHEGGFALVTGDPGNGKSATLRLLAERLAAIPEVMVGEISRPQSKLGDFYRELGDLFALEFRSHNRWGGFKTLRERWKAHLEKTLLRPVLLIDEAPEMETKVLSELRLLASGQFDSQVYLTVVLAGDARLIERLQQPELVPLGSRIRTRLVLEYASRDELRALIEHALRAAGNPALMTKGLVDTIVDHAAGNHRVLMNHAAELLSAAVDRELAQLDETLFLELYEERTPAGRKQRRAVQAAP